MDRIVDVVTDKVDLSSHRGPQFLYGAGDEKIADSSSEIAVQLQRRGGWACGRV